MSVFYLTTNSSTLTRAAAYFISVIFHPLFVPTYMLVLLLLINPYNFGVSNISDGGFLVAQVVLTTILFPLFSMFMLKQLDFISSIELKKREERIAPFMIIGMFYIGLAVFFIKTPSQIPNVLSITFLGATIALWISFIINLFTKVSVHTVGAGGLLGMVIIGMFHFEYTEFYIKLGSLGYFNIKMKILLMAFILVAGLVGTSRLILKAHSTEQIYLGYFVGFICQFMALNFLT